MMVRLQGIGRIAAFAVAGTVLSAALSAAWMPNAAAVDDDHAHYTAAELAMIYRHSPLGNLPNDGTNHVADDPRAARFGQHLFFETAFSKNGKVSCETCHQPTLAFTDGKAIAVGVATGVRNAPTILNAAYSPWFFLDGRTDSMWSQALQPFENPLEFGGDRLQIIHAVARDPAMRKAYDTVFGDWPWPEGDPALPAHGRPGASADGPQARAWAALSPDQQHQVNLVFSNLGKAIEAYERELVGGNSPFDQYVAALRKGDITRENVISPAAKRGLKLFVGQANCELCHSGPNFSDGQFHNLGLPTLPGEATDPGRSAGIALIDADIFNAAGAFSDAPQGKRAQRLQYLPDAKTQLGAFKTPSLRNIDTPPYMHDGRYATLEQVLDFYSDGADGVRDGPHVGVREKTVDLVPHLSAAQRADLIAFLKTLDDAPLPDDLTRAPPRP
ncbi:cytochrome-c peroxidase [Solimonas marina]|uniref:Methylamine utilization protein n=1 Tax=Solimonas marina TaxID=2714601 RepID=A0A969WAI6_9GAMM|nr:cytochrome c peroxidase [Solimonas marina]NKF23382.1 methylamine utilization protein [Solimonas marina]